MSKSVAIEMSPDLVKWLDTCVEMGLDRATIRANMRANGYSRDIAERICFQYFGPVTADEKRANKGPKATLFASTSGGEVAEWFEPSYPMLGALASNQIAADHGQIRILARCERPYAVSLGNILSAQECEQLMAYAQPRLERAKVVSEDGAEGDVDERRTASEAAIALGETELIQRIDQRIAQLTGIPVEHGEGLQVMRYLPGQEYQPHFDFFNSQTSGGAARIRRGQRVSTLVMYLNDVDAGGETIFPEASLEICPQQGNAVYFAYMDDNGNLDRKSLHGGLPVHAGEKWIATKWLRDRPFVP